MPEEPTRQFGDDNDGFLEESGYRPRRRRSAGAVWTSVILLLAAGVALLFFILWLSDRGDTTTTETTVTRTVERTVTQSPEPDVRLPSELPSPDVVEDWGNQLGDNLDRFLDDLGNRLNN